MAASRLRNEEVYFDLFYKGGYSKSSIIGTSINVILAIPGLIKNSKKFEYIEVSGGGFEVKKRRSLF